MKKTGLFICLFLASYHVDAQFTKGTRMAGASIGSLFFNATHSEYTYAAPTYFISSSNGSSYGLSLTPNLGWFINSSTVIGGQLLLNYKYDKKTDESNGSTYNREVNKSFSAGAGVFARHYFSDAGKFLPYAQLAVGATTGSSRTTGFSYSFTYKDSKDSRSTGDLTFNSGLSFGLTRMLNATTGLDLFAGYNYVHYKTDFKSVTLRDEGINGSIDERIESAYKQNFNSHGFSIGVGIQVFLPR